MEPSIEALVTAGRLDLLVARLDTASGIGARRFLVDAIERAVLLADPGAISTELHATILAVGISPSLLEGLRAPVPPHAVLLPFVTDGGLGFGRLVYVSASPDLRNETIDGAIALAAARAQPVAPLARYGLSFAQPAIVPRLDVSGRSLGAATLVSAVALFSGRRVLPATLISGELEGERIASVGGLFHKLTGCVASRADLSRAIVPSRNAASVRAHLPHLPHLPRIDVLGVATVGALLDAALSREPRGPADPEGAVAEARQAFRRGWDGYRWRTQREPLERLLAELPAYRPDLLVDVLTMHGAVHRHLGAPDESARILAEARAIVESPRGDEAVPDEQRTLLAQHEALTFAKLCRFDEASARADEAIEVARRGRLRGELLKAHGCAGLVALARGKPTRAVKHQRKALHLVRSHRPSAAPRTAGYLIDALGRAGRLTEARATYRDAIALVGRGQTAARNSREAWLRVSWAGALSAAGNHRDVRRVLAAECITDAIATMPLPGLIARRLLGIALSAGRSPERGWDLLTASPVVHGRGLLPHVLFVAQLNVLVEAQSRAARGALDGDAVARAQSALTHLPDYGDVPIFLGAARRRAARALAAMNERRVESALGALLDRALRLT